MSEYTVRGRIEHNVEHRIKLFDGRFDTAYRVKKFYMYPNDGIGAGNDAHAVIYTEEGAVANGLDWDWSENEQIGWAAGVFSGSGPHSDADGNGIVDPDNLIVEDLFIIMNHGNAGTAGYMIVMEKVEITDWQGALAMVRNRSQA